ncbi:AraC family transcriptional regulator [Enterobacter cancerogenus]|uniref:AraC family transcriptional regulator n=1 Tax=Enterobacter cancerogenus TaxID=69218 RepID=A0A484X0T0_9ENTR|nr:AraC family transcriptional regulator [Enterobacter cancerogenus]
MRDNSLPADQQFFADLFSGLVLNPQQLGRVWFAHRPSSTSSGTVALEWPRLDVVLRGEYGNLLIAEQKAIRQGEMLFLPSRTVCSPTFARPVMLLSIIFAPSWLGLAFQDARSGQAVEPQRKVELPHPERGECAAMLTALTHLSASPQDQDIIQPLVLSLLNWCRKRVSSLPEPGMSRGDFLYQSICSWIQVNYAGALTRESVAALFNISPNHLSAPVFAAGHHEFCGLCSLGAYGKSADDPAKISPAGGGSGEALRLSRQRLLLPPVPASVWPDAGGSTARDFSSDQKVISALSRSSILCGESAAKSDARNALLTSFLAS